MTPQEIANTPGLGSTGFGFSLPDFKLPVSFDFSAALAAIQKDNPQLAESIKQQQAKQDLAKAQQNLTQQILAQGTASQWSGQGFGSAEANARNMAEILAGIGINDIRQFGEVKKTVPADIQYTVPGLGVVEKRGDTFYKNESYEYGDGGTSTRSVRLTDAEAKNVKATYGRYVDSFVGEGDNQQYVRNFNPVDPAKIVTKDGVPSIETGETTYGNKLTGQAVPSTYGERQTGNAWGGTFAGKGNTGYRVQFAPDGTPVFYTTAASSNDLANILQDNKLLNFAANAAASYFGGPIGVAALQLAQGKDIEDAAKAAVISYVANEAGAYVRPEVAQTFGGGTAGNVAADAVIGGTLAEAQGGDFLRGALQSGISSGINEAKLSAADQYINSVEPGIGYDPATSPTELDVIAAYPELAPPIDTSLNLEAIGQPSIANISDFPVQNFGVPVDVNTPFYTQENTSAYTQSDDGTMTYTWDDGSTITVDPSFNVLSFTNATDTAFVPVDTKPEVKEPTEEAPKDISGELAALDLVKALAPFAVTAALAKDQPQATTDEQTGYPILPIPSEWKAPEYSMAFTPSAALDFGSPDLLQGTQWANQQVQPTQMNYSLSDVINTLNYQSVPFMQQQMQPVEQSFAMPDILQQFQTKPTVGVNDIIGGLNGRQVSISDIISGIQSQYGQKAAS